MSPIKRTRPVRARDRQRAVEILKALSEESGDAYVGYTALYELWCSNNAAVQELRPQFRMPGIEPGGVFSVSDSFRAEVRSLAAQILPLMLDAKPIKD